MAKKTAPLLPTTEELLRQFGDRLRLARLRRQLSAKQVAERAGMTPMTLRSLERGGSGVTIGAYLAVMQVLGIEKDLDLLGKADPIGRELQDARLPERQTRKALVAQLAYVKPKTIRLLQDARLPERQKRKLHAAKSEPLRESIDPLDAPRKEVETLRERSEDALDWINKGDFASSEALANLISPLASGKKKVR